MARWHLCNVLMAGPQARQLWQFTAGGSKVTLQRQETKLPNEPLPEKLVAKDWQTLFQPRLDVAWLAADKAFVRVVQLPAADAAETHSMVELQLEKLSPLPVAQIVWSYEVLPRVRPTAVGHNLAPHATGELQTVIVVMAARHQVEEYLGQIEGQGYLADRLELPLLDELRATKVEGNGAWIFPEVGGSESICMIAWWYENVLQNLTLVHLPAGERRAAAFQEQIAQASWAGEVEGWLMSEPRFHLVADDAMAARWLPLFDPAQAPEVIPPVARPDLAALTVRRMAANGASTNLLPPEYASRYKQRFIDRLWMRSLGSLLVVYVLGVAVYFGCVQFAAFRYRSVQSQMAQLGPTYTNTLRLKEKLRVLQETLELQYAALDCYKSIADTLPEGLIIKRMTFDRGRSVSFYGAAPTGEQTKVFDFNSKLIQYTMKGQRLYANVAAPRVTGGSPGQSELTWNFSCELKRTDASE